MSNCTTASERNDANRFIRFSASTPSNRVRLRGGEQHLDPGYKSMMQSSVHPPCLKVCLQSSVSNAGSIASPTSSSKKGMPFLILPSSVRRTAGSEARRERRPFLASITFTHLVCKYGSRHNQESCGAVCRRISKDSHLALGTPNLVPDINILAPPDFLRILAPN